MKRDKDVRKGGVSVQSPVKDLSAILTTLFDISHDAILLFDGTGTILQTNDRARMLLGDAKASLANLNVKDLFYLFNMERAPRNMFPFPTDGSGVTIFSKLPDGSFIPVEVHCKTFFEQGKTYYLLVARNTDLARQNVHERERLVRQLRKSNIRLEGMLSIISSTLGSNEFEDLTTRVLDTLAEVMEASGTLLYLVEEKGYRLAGASTGNESLRVGTYFVKLFRGVPGLVDKRRSSVSLQFVPPTREELKSPEAAAIDHKNGERIRIRSIMPSLGQSVVGLPLFSGDSLIGMILVYWKHAHVPLPSDLLLMETVASYLSVEFTSALSTMRHRKKERLDYLITQVKEMFYSAKKLDMDLFRSIANTVREEVPFDYVIVRTNKWNKTRLADFSSVNGTEFEQYEFPFKSGLDYPQTTGAIAIDQSDKIGQWVAQHSELTHGALISLGVLFDERIDVLVMRPSSSVPLDEMEVDFLSRLAITIRDAILGEQERAKDSKISKALQLAMKNELPEIEGITTASLYNSATAQAVVGGDYFDVHELSGHRILVTLGDISGKGVEAASMGSLVKTAIAAYAWNQMNPAQIVSALNTLFLNFSRVESFTTLFVAIIDLVKRRGKYCSAGHPPAFLYHPHEGGGGELGLLTVQSPIVGAFEGLEYKNGTIEIATGDILYLYTDGTTEARNPEGDFFGEDALREEFLNVVGKGVEELPQNILACLERYSRGSLMDDVAMVAIRFDEPPVEKGQEADAARA